MQNCLNYNQKSQNTTYYYSNSNMKTKKLILDNLIFSLLGVLFLVAFWAIFSAVYSKPLLVPGVGAVLSGFASLLSNREFYVSVGATFLRALAAFVAAMFFAILFAVTSASSRRFSAFVRPFVVLISSTPTMAILLLMLVFLSSQWIPVVVSALMAFPLLYSSFIAALGNLSGVEQVATVYDVSRFAKIRYVYLPSIFGVAEQHVANGLALALKVVISGEVVAYTRGSVGLAMRSAQINVETDVLLAYVLTSFLLSAVAALLVRAVFLIIKRRKR